MPWFIYTFPSWWWYQFWNLKPSLGHIYRLLPCLVTWGSSVNMCPCSVFYMAAHTQPRAVWGHSVHSANTHSGDGLEMSVHPSMLLSPPFPPASLLLLLFLYVRILVTAGSVDSPKENHRLCMYSRTLPFLLPTQFCFTNEVWKWSLYSFGCVLSCLAETHSHPEAWSQLWWFNKTQVRGAPNSAQKLCTYFSKQAATLHLSVSVCHSHICTINVTTHIILLQTDSPAPPADVSFWWLMCLTLSAHLPIPEPLCHLLITSEDVELISITLLLILLLKE